MKRRLACILLAALLLLGLCCTASAETPAATEAQLWNITDTVGLLTQRFLRHWPSLKKSAASRRTTCSKRSRRR